MDLIGFSMVSLLTMGTFAVGIFAGGCFANWEDSRNKNLARKTDEERYKERAAQYQ